ncbi:MAG: hypothetical protein EBS39_01145 [Gammaproteobacteria bacterium]|nr:hypothetical protein [Gammaproteobacteria bacterium]
MPSHCQGLSRSPSSAQASTTVVGGPTVESTAPRCAPTRRTPSACSEAGTNMQTTPMSSSSTHAAGVMAASSAPASRVSAKCVTRHSVAAVMANTVNGALPTSRVYLSLTMK